MSGVSAAGTLTMGLIALPAMLERGYDKHMATGCIAAGGALGVLIPPSIPFIVYGLMAGASIGRLFLGGVFPGLMLAGLFVLYIGIRCGFKPQLGPPLPKAERPDWPAKLRSLKAVVLPIILVMLVLGSIFTGIATPTEAAAVGALGSIICAVIYRKLSWRKMKDVSYQTVSVTAMVLWIIGAAAAFSSIYSGLGAMDFIRDLMRGLNVNPWVILIFIQLTLFVFGMFLDPNGIMLITLPIYIPVITALGFDVTWFGILFVMNMEMGYITPPFGWNLFYLKGVAPKSISMSDIYNSVWPFVGLQALALAIVMAFPAIAMYLPDLLLSAK
jgi:tripartite ATP-independent transporter DctM subunit